MTKRKTTVEDDKAIEAAVRNIAALDATIVAATVRPIVAMIRALPSPNHAIAALGNVVRTSLGAIVLSGRDGETAIGHLSRSAVEGVAASAQREAAKAARAAATAPRPEGERVTQVTLDELTGGFAGVTLDAEIGEVDSKFVQRIVDLSKATGKTITGRHNDRLVTVEPTMTAADAYRLLTWTDKDGKPGEAR